MKYWLMKSEPDVFGIDHLARAPGRRSGWDGVRNYQARNMLRDDFSVGDRAFFHHSSCEMPGIYGTIEIVRAGHPDPSQFDRRSKYYDAGSDPANPRWYQVEVRLLKKFARPGDARDAARACRSGVEGPGRVASWQSPLGDAGERRGMEIHPSTRARIGCEVTITRDDDAIDAHTPCLHSRQPCIYSTSD